MDVKELSMMMKAEAVKNGLCQKWTEEWSDFETVGTLLDKYVRGIDFCIRTGFPTAQQLIEYGGDELEKHRIYAQGDVTLYNPGNIIVIGDCNAEITIENDMSEIWVRDGAKVAITVKSGGSAYVRMTEDSTANVMCSFFSDAYVYRYSDNAVVASKGNVQIRDRVGFYKNTKKL